MPGGRLTQEDRRHIAAGLAEGLGYAEIARRLGRPTSTVSREVAAADPATTDPATAGPTATGPTTRTWPPGGAHAGAGWTRPRDRRRLPAPTGVTRRRCAASWSGSRR